MILPIFLLAISASPCSAYASTAHFTTEVTNQISLGDVNISLDEFEYDQNGNEVAYKDHKVVLPGEKIDRIIRISNHANAVWLRAKITYTDCGDEKGFSDDDIVLASDQWVKRGEYYYYTPPLESKATVDFIKAFSIPSSWSESKAGMDFDVDIAVDAVQKANFTPDFSSADPWFGTVIEECVHTTHDNIKTETSDQAFSITFENGSEGLVKVDGDFGFFSNWSSLMPGDTVSDTVTIGNNYDDRVAIYFRTETIADDSLLEKVHLIIKNGDTTVYDGGMNGEITQEVQLGYLRRGETRNLTYTVSIPAELTNEYALANTRTKWIFSCSYHNRDDDHDRGSDRDSGSDNSNHNGDGGSNHGGDETNSSTPDSGTVITDTLIEVIQKIPKLGDSNLSQIILCASAIGLFIVGVVGVPRKKKKKGEAGKDV